MKINLKLFASLVTLFAACLVHAAATAPAPGLPVLSVQQVATDDSTGYATWCAKTNEIAKAKLGIEGYLHIYTGQTGDHSQATFAVSLADSFATLTKNGAALQNDPDLIEVRNHLRAIRTLGQRTLYKAVRFDGGNKGASIYNTFANVSDEAGYLKALDGLRAAFDAHGLKDAKINAYRVVAGRTTFSHLISINVPSDEALAMMLDQLSEPWMGEWLAGAAKYRTVVSNGTYKEITK